MSETVTPLDMSPSELFCMSQGTTNRCSLEKDPKKKKEKDKLYYRRCHWCRETAANDPKMRHDDIAPLPFTKSKWKAACPAEPFVCHGCNEWRKSRRTITFLNGTFRDSQTIIDNSWWIDTDNCLAVSDISGNPTVSQLTNPPKSDYEILAEKLLHPPNLFVLCFKSEDPKIPNWLHLCKLNDNKEINELTPLYFTAANIPYTYTVYELSLALKKGSEVNQEPGTAYLVNLFRPFYPLENPDGGLEEDKRGKGRPKNDVENRPGKKV